MDKAKAKLSSYSQSIRRKKANLRTLRAHLAAMCKGELNLQLPARAAVHDQVMGLKRIIELSIELPADTRVEMMLDYLHSTQAVQASATQSARDLRRRLLSVEEEPSAEEASTRVRTGQALSDVESSTSARHSARQGAQWGHRWHVHHRHRPHVHHRHRPHLHHRHAAQLICQATKLVKEAAVGVAQAALNVELGALRVAQGFLNAAKGVLHAALMANAAAFSLMQGLLSAAMKIQGISVSATLRPNLLNSCLSASVKMLIKGRVNMFTGELCLKDLTKMIMAVVKSVVKQLMSWFPVPKKEEFLSDEYDLDAFLIQLKTTYTTEGPF